VSTPSTTETIRARVLDLTARRGRGDLSPRAFERAVGPLHLALYRAVAAERLPAGERVELEHHAVLGHLRLAESVLREPEQDAVSLLLSERHLLRIRTRLVPGRAFTCDGRDQTVVDLVPRAAISALAVERSIRPGEVATGAAILALALAASPLLQVTAPFLAGVGVLGMLHGLLVPTRVVRVVTADGQPAEEILVHAPRTRSARRLVAALRGEVERRGGSS
jgi:hypothetical protein